MKPDIITPWYRHEGVWQDSDILADALCSKIIFENNNMLIPWYLMCCYAYYHKNVSLISDELFDTICMMLDKCYFKIQHIHKYLIKPPLEYSGDRMQTKTSAHTIEENSYPEIIKDSARRLIETQCRHPLPPVVSITIIDKVTKKKKTYKSTDSLLI